MKVYVYADENLLSEVPHFERPTILSLIIAKLQDIYPEYNIEKTNSEWVMKIPGWGFARSNQVPIETLKEIHEDYCDLIERYNEP